MFYLIFIYIWFIYFIKEKIPQKYLLLIAALPIFSIIWLRFGFGADYFSYANMYDTLLSDSLANLFRRHQVIEPGYRLLMWPFKALGINFHVFFAIINSLTFIIFLKWIKDNSNNYILSMIIFYSMFFTVWILSAARQGLVLSLSLYLLFNRKKEFSLSKSLFIILLLSTIHVSAFIMVPFLILDKVKWNRRRHLIFISLSVLVSVFPIHLLLNLFKSIPSVDKIIRNYLTVNHSIFDFSSIMRLFIFGLVILFYNNFSKDDRKYYVDRLLFGFSLYFLLRFSELTAARLTVYTYIIIVVIIPLLVEMINIKKLNTKTVKLVAYSTIIISTSVLYQKELTTMKQQSMYLDDSRFVKFESIIYSNYNKFGKINSYRINKKKLLEAKKNEFLENKITKNVKYNDKHKYTIIENSPSRFRIYNQDGNWLEKKVYYSDIEFIDGIVLVPRFEENHFFSHINFEDLSGLDRSNEEMKKIVEKSKKDKIFTDIVENPIEVDMNAIPDSLLHYYPDHNNITEVKLSYFPDGNYYVMRVEYFEDRSFIYLDKDMKPIFDILFNNAVPFGDENMVVLYTDHGKILINNKGDILWWEPNTVVEEGSIDG